MGYYIQTGSLTKAEGIIKLGGIEIPQPNNFSDVSEKDALVVVVNNGMFEAAGLVYSPEEFKAFTLPSDHRPKRFFLLEKEVAHKAAGYNG